MKSKEQYIIDAMRKDGINEATILFFIQLLGDFETVDTIESTTKAMEKRYKKNKRTILRYIKTLCLKNYLIDIRIKRPSNKNPDHVYIKHQYELTAKTYNIMSMYQTQQLRGKRVMQIE